MSWVCRHAGDVPGAVVDEVILTQAPPTDETHPSYGFLTGDVRDAVATALTAAGGRDGVALGANVVNQCLGAGLVDEILMPVVPELVGDRVRLVDASTLVLRSRRSTYRHPVKS